MNAASNIYMNTAFNAFMNIIASTTCLHMTPSTVCMNISPSNIWMNICANKKEPSTLTSATRTKSGNHKICSWRFRKRSWNSTCLEMSRYVDMSRYIDTSIYIYIYKYVYI